MLLLTTNRKKTANYRNQKAALPNLGNLPQVGNQWSTASCQSVYQCVLYRVAPKK